LLNNKHSVTLAVQRALDTGTSLKIVSKVLNRELKNGERDTFAELIPEWMKKHQFSFCSMETADVILTHENFMSVVQNRAFKEVNTETLYRGPVSPRAIEITEELFDIVKRHREKIFWSNIQER